MPAEKNETQDIANFFKKELKLEPKQLTLEYMRKQGRKIQTPYERERVERSIRKAEYPVLILGDNEKPAQPSKVLEALQAEIGQRGFLCALGSHIYFMKKGEFEDEIERQMLENPDFPMLILLVSGSGFGTIGESKHICLEPELNGKTLFFFDHNGDYDRLIELAEKKQFPVQFKYPIPYSGHSELRGKVIFGVLHCFYRYLRFKRKKDSENNNNENRGCI